VLVALTQRRILRLAEPRRDSIAVRAADVLAVDGNRPAAALDRHHLAAAGAFAERGTVGGRFLRIVVREAVGAAGADGERAGRRQAGSRPRQWRPESDQTSS